jgi:capsular exopolysaccharide synthesis family protein
MSRLFEAAGRAGQGSTLTQQVGQMAAAEPDAGALDLFGSGGESPTPPMVDVTATNDDRPLRTPLATVDAPARGGASPRLLTDVTWAPALAEYRRLAATLAQQSERGVRAFLVTSAVPGEGKSLTAAHLAMTLTDVYRRRVLLVDGDMRRPTLHTWFGTNVAPGFADSLRMGRLVGALSVRPNLTFVPAGRPDGDPGSLLLSPSARPFITQLSEEYDWVIIDTPPAVLLPDAELLSAMVDMAVLVVQAGRTRFDDVDRVIASIGRDRIAGVVLNRTPKGSGRAHSKYKDYAAYYEGESAGTD